MQVYYICVLSAVVYVCMCVRTVVVKIKFRFSIRTTAVERVNRCRIEPVLLQNGDRKTTVAQPCYGHRTAQCA